MENNLILFVCVANYCRSPVAEKLFNHNNNTKYNAESVGLIDFKKKSMDLRSAKFLQNINIKNTQHIPRKISRQLLEKSLILFALDKKILSALRSQFPDSYAKFKLITKEEIKDPINMQKDDYLKIMSQIETSIQEIKNKL